MKYKKSYFSFIFVITNYFSVIFSQLDTLGIMVTNEDKFKYNEDTFLTIIKH
jgi:hypothetical protein